MRHVKTSRRSAALWLLAGVIASAAMATHSKPESIQTRKTVAPPDAPSWLEMAREAESKQLFRRATAAYAKALEVEPFCNEALIHHALCLAAGGDTKGLETAMEELVIGHAKLAVAVFDSPQLRTYMDCPPFSDLIVEARSQAVD